MFSRLLQLPTRGSFFLFGARGVGKSTEIKARFAATDTHIVNLLLPELEQRYALRPMTLAREVASLPATIKRVVIDEVQKVPQLLDVVQHLIEDQKSRLQFVLTGSSARKLKAGSANLLAGRAAVHRMFPLFTEELGGADNIESLLRFGSLPVILQYPTEARDSYLRSYATTYLKEEVASEQLVRKIEPFRRFLPVAAQMSGEIVNYTSIAQDVGVDIKTVKSYFSILEDTLLGFFVEPWHDSVRKRQRKAPKFFFFDTGVTRALAGQLKVVPEPSTSYFGQLFEQRVIQEIVHRDQTLELDLQLGYLRTEKAVEVDLIVQRPNGRKQLIEIKSTEHVREKDTRHLRVFEALFPNAELLLLSRDRARQKFGKIRALPWDEGVMEIAS